jgi:hypothetical protein
MEAQQSNIYQLGIVSVEIFKNENKTRYQLMIPLGSKWDEAIAVCDEFKSTIAEMKKSAEDAQEQRNQAVPEAA